MAYTALLVDLAEGVLTLTLNRPDVLNAFNTVLAGELLEALAQAERDPIVRCVVLTGAGKGFCAGQDLAELRDRPEPVSLREHLQKTYNRLAARLSSLEKPVIAQINGVTAGAGLGLALACDLRYASVTARFRMAFSGIGLAPDTGLSFFLPRLIGYARAYELAVFNTPLSAEQALQWGVLNGVYAPEDLVAQVRARAVQLAAGPTRAFGLTKRAMQKAAATSLAEVLDYEAYLQEIAGRTQDHAEGVAAFLEKRTPRYQGK